jgi:NAD(P)-dependent dehydrogenase (short-subunit alcohol dehydrogenase family)
MRFEDKVVLVTGASRGIGFAAALAFLREGASVALVSNERIQSAEIVEKQFPERALQFQADISREDEVARVVEQIVSRWERIDILVNNAGIYRQGDVVQTDLSEWERVLAVNLTGSFLCSKLVSQLMISNGGGVIVNVASEAGLVGIKGQVAYNVSKAGQIALTRSCAVDLADKGIRVNCICPGTTDTPLVQEAVNRTPDPAAARRALEVIRPANRLGKPEEIAAAILALASDELGYATGAILSIDGGYTAQ